MLTNSSFGDDHEWNNPLSSESDNEVDTKSVIGTVFQRTSNQKEKEWPK